MGGAANSTIGDFVASGFASVVYDDADVSRYVGDVVPSVWSDIEVVGNSKFACAYFVVSDRVVSFSFSSWLATVDVA